MTKKMRYKVTPAVWLCLFRTKDNGEIEVLLQKRQNTGYMDNRYDLSVSGHLEPGENASQAVVREAKEEIGIEVALEDLEFLTLVDAPAEGYLKLFFTTKQWKGTPRIMEPEKCSELLWSPLNNLPSSFCPTLIPVIRNIQQKRYYDII